MAKPWEELHTAISTEEEFQEAINYKGLTCARPDPAPPPRGFRPRHPRRHREHRGTAGPEAPDRYSSAFSCLLPMRSSAESALATWDCGIRPAGRPGSAPEPPLPAISETVGAPAVLQRHNKSKKCIARTSCISARGTGRANTGPRVKAECSFRASPRDAAAGMEVHAGWCGPCTAVVPTMKKISWEQIEERRSATAQRPRPKGAPSRDPPRSRAAAQQRRPPPTPRRASCRFPYARLPCSALTSRPSSRAAAPRCSLSWPTATPSSPSPSTRTAPRSRPFTLHSRPHTRSSDGSSRTHAKPLGAARIGVRRLLLTSAWAVPAPEPPGLPLRRVSDDALSDERPPTREAIAQIRRLTVCAALRAQPLFIFWRKGTKLTVCAPAAARSLARALTCDCLGITDPIHQTTTRSVTDCKLAQVVDGVNTYAIKDYVEGHAPSKADVAAEE